MGRIRSLWLFLGLVLFAVSVYDVTADVIPSENECRPYIEKAIHELKSTEPTPTETESIEDENIKTGEVDASIETTTTTSEAVEESVESAAADEVNSQEQEQGSVEVEENKEEESTEGDNKSVEEAQSDSKEEANDENSKEQNDTAEEDAKDSKEEDKDSKEEGVETAEQESTEAAADSKEAEEEPVEEGQESLEETENNAAEQDADSNEAESDNKESAEAAQTVEDNDTKEDSQPQTEEDNSTKEEEVTDDNEDSVEEKVRSKRSIEEEVAAEPETETAENETKEDTQEESDNNTAEETDNTTAEDTDNKSAEESENKTAEETDNSAGEETENSQENVEENATAENDSKQEESQEQEQTTDEESTETGTEEEEEEEVEKSQEQETMPEEELTLEFEIPKNLRNREHISDLLGLDVESSIKENALKRTGDVILKELKRVYDNAIKPLETMYKYRDLSNRHYGDPEIFSKPLVLFMGPYSGGKSTILNYLTDNEYTVNSIRSGAEPSPAYFNILMHGEEPEVLDGTQLAADWTFSGLQKFGQGLMDRLRGQKLPSKLLERVNIVEIPGILEVRKQVSRYFPFNDACQWFIDRADIIFLVYDPAKLDVGPETEAILDQLKGREYQTRILLNKGDSVKPEELMRVQSALIWNISPLMSSAQPPVMYTVSLWSHPYEQGSPVRLLQAQERAMLADLREAIDKRIENKIASARRFAVRIRNHAKMVDCYLTTYYNQKSLFSNKKQVSDKIIEHPQNYNIYEGLSTLTNISRYDLPDPEVYLDFFRLNPLYEFKKLSETCTYFKGCPINKLDIAIAYDLPELVGKYKKLLEENYSKLRKEFDENCNQSSVEPPVKLSSR